MASKQPEGIVFPLNDKNDRSTSDAQKKLFSEIFKKSDSQLSQQVLAEKNWRFGYTKYFMKHVQQSLKSPQAALDAAQTGLDWMHDNFEFVRDGKTYKVSEAMKTFKGSFETGVIKGQKQRSSYELEVPYKGRTLRGEELVKQVNKWASYGTIEPSAAEAITAVAKNSKWADLSDKYFVLLGAGSAMGPYQILMALGANVIAIDLDRPNIWRRLISIAEQSSGTLTFPLKKPQDSLKTPEELYEQAGSNLITQAPEILNWLSTVHSDKQLTVGCYVYLDGEAHVKVVLACDAIMKGLTENRKAGIAFLCTPTDIHVIPDEARRASLSRYNAMDWRNLAVMPVRLSPGHRMLQKNALPTVTAQDGTEFSLVDGIAVAQGPNYALAKRMQHWRAIVARNGGCWVSSHIAPSTSTASVVHNKQFAWAYDGMPFFIPYEIFEQETSNAVMSAILIHDLRNTSAVAYPSVPLKNPLELFKHNSFHGGVWRCAYKCGSIGEVSVIVHFIKVLKPVLIVLALLILFLLYRYL